MILILHANQLCTNANGFIYIYIRVYLRFFPKLRGAIAPLAPPLGSGPDCRSKSHIGYKLEKREY